MNLSVIIVSYNVKCYLEQCIRSLFVSAREFSYEVWVVDNASSDGSVEYIQERFPAREYPQLHLIANSRNVGFGRANNMALERATGERVLFLNPDTVLTEKTLTDCFGLMDTRPEVGAVGVKMLKNDGSFALESRRGLPSPFTAFCKMSGLAGLFPKSRLFGKYYMRYLDEEKENPVDVISGAFMLIPRKVLTYCGGFDEDFFMYGEDIDLSYRLQKAGYVNFYVPTPILHYKGESTEKSSYRYVHVFYQAMLIFFDKHYNHYSFWFSIPIRIAIYARAVLALLKQQADNLKSMVQDPITKQRNEERYLIIGPRDMIEEAEKLCKKWILDATYQVVDDVAEYQGHESLSKEADYKFVVYDIDFFGFDRILSYFKNHGGEQIGLYSMQTGNLITAKNVYGK